MANSDSAVCVTPPDLSPFYGEGLESATVGHVFAARISHLGRGLRNAAGVIFAHFYVQIVVGSTSGAFAVTHVTYDLSTFNDGGNTGCPMVTAHISVNKAGDVQYHWVRSDGPETGQTLHFSSSGTQDVQEKWYLGSAATGTQWLGIYIDAPNHQDFGHTNINKCITP